LASNLTVEPTGATGMRRIFRRRLAGILRRKQQFLADESGASTVEMVVMMAAGISLGLAATNQISAGIEDLANTIKDHLTNYEIKTSFDE